MKLRSLAWELLAYGRTLQATYYDGADLFVTDQGKQKITSERTLALHCPAAHLDRVFDRLGPGTRAIAMSALPVNG